MTNSLLGQLSVDAHCYGVCRMWRSQSNDSETTRGGKGIFSGGCPLRHVLFQIEKEV